MGCDQQQSVNNGNLLAFTAESSEFWLTADWTPARDLISPSSRPWQLDSHQWT
jgi:hypothetical protein